jgi:SAM-dependent methyltransferase
MRPHVDVVQWRAMKTVLNVGGHDKTIPLPPQYAEFQQLLLDIDPAGKPDVVCDARKLTTLDAGQFDAVYCSHNLEHYYRHEVPRVLAGFVHVLKPGGFAQIQVPDIQAVMSAAVARGLDVEDTLYQSPAGPITVADVVYGWGLEIERSGNDFFAHKYGFTEKSLLRALTQAGFAKVYVAQAGFELGALAFKGAPDPAMRAMFGLPE